MRKSAFGLRMSNICISARFFTPVSCVYGSSVVSRINSPAYSSILVGCKLSFMCAKAIPEYGLFVHNSKTDVAHRTVRVFSLSRRSIIVAPTQIATGTLPYSLIHSPERAPHFRGRKLLSCFLNLFYESESRFTASVAICFFSDLAHKIPVKFHSSAPFRRARRSFAAPGFFF